MTKYSLSSPPKHTAGAHQGVGCASLLRSPFYLVLLILAIFLMANGKTTQPWDLAADQSADSAAGQSQSGLSQLFTPEVLYWEENILRWAANWDLDPNLVAAVMQIESCGDPTALSPAGAIGLFQVMPYHFQSSDNPYHPETNALRGMAYLKEAFDTYGSIRLSLAGYNGGIAGAAKPENTWSDETSGYVYWGTNIYQDAAAGRNSSPTLDEWLISGGASLCSQADLRLGLTP
jgi:soluble lytic murein transglycosylase-like protein